jgi:hypothetical protein
MMCLHYLDRTEALMLNPVVWRELAGKARFCAVTWFCLSATQHCICICNQLECYSLPAVGKGS